MRKLSFILLSMMAISSIHAERILLPKHEILFCEEGLYLMIGSHLLPASSIEYVGNGLYSASYHGTCGRCGVPIDENGKCQNRHCNQYGPNKD